MGIVPFDLSAVGRCCLVGALNYVQIAINRFVSFDVFENIVGVVRI